MHAPAARPGILDIAPYVGGECEAAGPDAGDAAGLQRRPAGPPARAPSRPTAPSRRRLHRYPDGGADGAARRHRPPLRPDLPKEHIVCGAGSDELIALLTRAYAGPGDEVLYSQYGFLMYGIAAKTVGATPVAAPAKDLRRRCGRPAGRGRRRARASSSSPTRTIRRARCCRRPRCGGCMRGLPADVLLVLDAAYAEYVGGADYEDGRCAGRRDHGNAVMTAHLLEDLRHGGAAARLGLCPAGGGRRAEPRARAVQRAGAGPGRRRRRPGRPRPSGQGAAPTTTSGCPGWRRSSRSSACSRCPASATSSCVRFPDPALTADVAAAVPQRPGHPAAPDGRLRPGRLPAHHHRHRRREAGRGRGARRFRRTARRRPPRGSALTMAESRCSTASALIGIGLIGSSIARASSGASAWPAISPATPRASAPATRRWS